MKRTIAFVIGKARRDEKGRCLEVWSDLVPEPVAVRYGWASNPDANLAHEWYDNLPVPTFLFAFCDHTPNNTAQYRFFLYEATLDESGSKVREVRQITGTGAGDAFTAGFLSGVHDDRAAVECLLRGVCVAGRASTGRMLEPGAAVRFPRLVIL